MTSETASQFDVVRRRVRSIFKSVCIRVGAIRVISWGSLIVRACVREHAFWRIDAVKIEFFVAFFLFSFFLIQSSLSFSLLLACEERGWATTNAAIVIGESEW